MHAPPLIETIPAVMSSGLCIGVQCDTCTSGLYPYPYTDAYNPNSSLGRLGEEEWLCRECKVLESHHLMVYGGV